MGKPAHRLREVHVLAAFISLWLTAEMPADDFIQQNGAARGSSTQAEIQQPLPSPTTSRRPWHINLAAASREAQATGRPMMLVFR